MIIFWARGPLLRQKGPQMTSTVSFFRIRVLAMTRLPPFPVYSTSGAKETIFMNWSRSSRATGPKTRVPIGSLPSLIKTAAF